LGFVGGIFRLEEYKRVEVSRVEVLERVENCHLDIFHLDIQNAGFSKIPQTDKTING
jgi:hypothetical protein